ncbi:MAG: AIR synthase family protein [Atribacterota bacterium]|nr:AIR synthase family protein [Atribacterota bacterium]MDD4896928.1 AIR synthase family protein [Atribacterota bacterium]MDD5636959.1 AIR synthase family protein [Atribacterota bacterium]
MKKKLPLGKLDFSLLERLLGKYQSKTDSRVIIGPKLGEDAAVIDFPDRYLVAKTDPITFATEEIGWYAVQVNANDIATRGAVPKWFQATILLPENKTTEELVANIFSQIQNACEELNITIIGGHTEVSYNLDRPIIVGCMLGEVEKHKLVSTSGAKPGDAIILTKGIVIEGTVIIAREKKEELEARGYQKNFIQRCQNYLYNPGLSVIKEALLANNMEVHAMHDPTEGGLAAGLYEIVQASGVGLLVEREKIPILEEAKILCKEYSLDPLRTITSGTLLIVTSLKSSQKIITLLEENKIKASLIGEIKEQRFGLKIATGGIWQDLKISAKDEITKIFA